MHTHIIFVVILPVNFAYIHIRCIYLLFKSELFFSSYTSKLRYVLVPSTWKYRIIYSQPQFSVRAVSFFINFLWQNFPCFLWHPFHLDSVLVCPLCFTCADPCTVLTMSLHVSCSPYKSCLQLEYSFYKPWQQQFLLHDSHILDFSCDSRAFKLHAYYKPMPLGQKMFPKIEVSTISLKIMTVLKKLWCTF